MTNEKNTLIWIDLEMSGLDPERDVILEAALVLTNNDLDIIAEGPVLAIHQNDSILDGMDEWNKTHHGRSGLMDRVRSSSLSEKDAEVTLISFLKEYLPPNASPMCGNSICQDRRFLARYMPYLESYFHYRNLDVSTIKELAKRWRPELLSGFKKENRHEALADIHESIEELRYYRQTFFHFE